MQSGKAEENHHKGVIKIGNWAKALAEIATVFNSRPLPVWTELDLENEDGEDKQKEEGGDNEQPVFRDIQI